jgi:uncharacterized membrane protein
MHHPSDALLWSNGLPVKLNGLSGNAFNMANAVSNTGEIVGTSGAQGSDLACGSNAVIFARSGDASNLQPVLEGVAAGVNDHGALHLLNRGKAEGRLNCRRCAK